MQHTELLNGGITNWENGGFSVDIEAQNSFQLRGSSATLAGKPDLIVQRDAAAVMVDVKTSHESASHAVQVMIYVYAIPRALEKYRTLKIRGRSRTATTRSAYRPRRWTTGSFRTWAH